MASFRKRVWPCAAGLIAAGLVPFPALAQADAQTGGWSQLPGSVYRGCEEAVAARAPATDSATATANASATPPSGAAVPRDRIAVQAEGRRLASFSIDEAEAQGDKAVVDACWRRLDGVWRADDVITLDPAVDPQDWAADNPALRDLSHGNYTRPQHVIVSAPDDPERALVVADVFNPEAVVTFVAADALTFDQVLVRGGARKRYVAQAGTGRANPIGSELFVDVTRSGQVRIEIGRRQFYRPRSNVAKSNQELPTSDVFLISYNLENMTASRRGYDVIQQDAFFFLNNPKREVFAPVDPRRYTIDEKRIVPLGLTLIQEPVQGMVYRNTLETSEEAVQTTAARSFGQNVSFSTPAFDLGPAKIAENKVWAGYKSAQEESRALSQRRQVARATAFSRSKLYTLVIDHPYAVLSDSFVTAIDDALRRGKREPDLYRRIIERFGTHYPYAVTYGAAAKVTRTLDEESYLETFGNRRESEKSGGAAIFGVAGEFSLGKMTGRSTSNAGTFVKEGASFVAVGGNGSWNESGFAPGQTPYPILLDLRPLHELLSPLTFPGEPEIYVGVRERLKQEIALYLFQNSAPPSTAPFRPLPRGIEGAYRIVGTNEVNRFWPSGEGGFEVARLTQGQPAQRFAFRRTGGAQVYLRQDGSAGSYTYYPSADALAFGKGSGTPTYLTKITDPSAPECQTLEPLDDATRAVIGGRVHGIYSEDGKFDPALIREFRSVGKAHEWLQFRYRTASGAWSQWTDWRERTPGSYMPVGGSNVFTVRDGGKAILFTAPGNPGTRPLMLYRVSNPPEQCAR